MNDSVIICDEIVGIGETYFKKKNIACKTDVGMQELILIKQVHHKGNVCHYCYFLNYSFKFEPNVCNRCHDLLMSFNLSDIAVINIKGSDYHCLLN